MPYSSFTGRPRKERPRNRFNFDPATGAIRFMDKAFDYIGCGLLGLKPRDMQLKITENGAERTLTYGEVIDALAANITVAPAGPCGGPRCPSSI